MLVDMHDVVHQPAALGERHDRRVAHKAVGAVDDQFRTQPITQHGDMRDEQDLDQYSWRTRSQSS